MSESIFRIMYTFKIKRPLTGYVFLFLSWRPIIIVFLLLITTSVPAQLSIIKQGKNDSMYVNTSLATANGNYFDCIDLYYRILKKKNSRDSLDKIPKRFRNSFVPGAGYTLQTKFAVVLAMNTAFYTERYKGENLSVINSMIAYSQNKQLIIPVQSNIWLKKNKYNLLGDWRYYKYPQLTYGLGSGSSLNNPDLLDYSYLEIHQVILRAIFPDFFIGAGYMLDYHWNIIETPPNASVSTDYQRYGSSTKTMSSGADLNFLFDNRRNPINPNKGSYCNISYRYNPKWLGSNNDWSSAIIDARKFFNLREKGHHVLAFWSYTWLILSGKAPYLDLPSTAWDTYSNIGRGYIQSRFRGNGLLYLESEYRFNILKSGFLGGVVFLNAQCVQDWPKNTYTKLFPGYGIGVRLKLNKHSNTNVALDYGWGTGSSNGFFVNVGEVF
jgi:hypothetical protein